MPPAEEGHALDEGIEDSEHGDRVYFVLDDATDSVHVHAVLGRAARPHAEGVVIGGAGTNLPSAARTVDEGGLSRSRGPLLPHFALCYALGGMVALPSLPPVSTEQRIVIHGIPWSTYVILREALDVPGLRMTYLEGALEIMSPSREHETNKKMIARLVEAYAVSLRLRLNGHGSTTFRREAKKRGVEPDECWVLGRTLGENDYPDIVLEIIETSPLVDKLDVYDGFGVKEVWIYEDHAFAIHRRRPGGGYARAAKSALLPQLDFALIAKLTAHRDQLDAIDALERALRGSSRRPRPRPRSKRERR